MWSSLRSRVLKIVPVQSSVMYKLCIGFSCIRNCANKCVVQVLEAFWGKIISSLRKKISLAGTEFSQQVQNDFSKT